MARLKTVISGKVIGELEALGERDAEKYGTFWTEFGRLVKEGVATDPANRDRLLKLLRFRSSRDDEAWVSLPEYKARTVEGQTEIYYLFGEDVHSIKRSPHLDMFRARGIEVLFLTETIDSFMIGGITEFDGAKLRNAADSDLDLPAASEPAENTGESLEDGAFQTVIDQFKAALGERVTEVRESKLLTDSPVRLVTADKGLGPDMERVYRMLDKPFEAPKRILEINRRHELIRNLASLPDETLRQSVMEQLYESALLLEGVHPNPAEMVPRIQALMEAATRH
jgi:molecular chaperone HtpG